MGLDIAKSVFQVHGVDSEGRVVVQRRLTRAKLAPFFQRLPRCPVGSEACATAPHGGRRLMAVPGVGPVLARAMAASVPDPHAPWSSPNLAAWIGLVPKLNSSGGMARLGGITKQGNRYLRQPLIVGRWP